MDDICNRVIPGPGLDAESCFRAYETRDERFDGRFFVAVRSTKIFCRPVCPARTPKRANVEFHPSAAAAFAAGFRPCLRCRPERAPRARFGDSPGAALVTRALAVIETGALNEGSLDLLSERIGVTSRHLRRLFEIHLGASPLAVAHTRRVMFARQLVEETALPLTQVAFAAGFASVRRFNDAFARAYRCAPGRMRRPPAGSGAAAARSAAWSAARSAALWVRLGPMGADEFARLTSFYRTRAWAGVESVQAGRYVRSVRIGRHCGTFAVRHDARMLLLGGVIGDPSCLPQIVARAKRMFDLEAPLAALSEHLARDPLLRPALRDGAAPRVPGAWDAYELGLRAILGQQVSVAAATTLAGRLAQRFGEPLPASVAGDGIDRLFPAPAVLAAVAVADLRALGIVGARAATLIGFARHVEQIPDWGGRYAGLDPFVASLCELPGIGAWTAHYVAMRGFADPDAFPAADLGLLRSARALGIAETARALERHAERWRPWRAYAAQALWNHQAKDAA